MCGSRCRKGFTFVEILISIVLVGLSITALVFATTNLTTANSAGSNLSTAEFLVEQIREMTTLLPVLDPQTEDATFGAEAGENTVTDYDDIDDFNGLTFSPPIDANGGTLNALAPFTQTVAVTNVQQSDFTATAGPHTTNFVRITVRVLLNGAEISSASWIRANY